MAFTGKAWQYSAVPSKLEDSLTVNTEATLPNREDLTSDQIIVEIISASLNPVDYKLPESHLLGTLQISRPATPGLDFCGRVVAKHPANAAFEEGQLVFGGFPGVQGPGTLRKYIVIAGKHCARLPEGIDPDDAAAVGTGATSAYQSLIPGTLKSGSRVFINGGSGGVGFWTIQMAKVMGAEVVATCSTGNVELCRQLGAEEVVDYRKVDVVAYLKQKGPVFDLFVDNVGDQAEIYNMRGQVVKSSGTFVQVGVGSALTWPVISSTLQRMLRPSFLGGPSFYAVRMKNTTEYLDTIGGWMAQGKIKAVIDSTHSWDEVPQAYRQLREGHAKGKIVIHVGE